MSMRVMLARAARVHGVERSAGWRGRVTEEEYERLRAAGVLADEPEPAVGAAAIRTRQVTLIQTAEVAGVRRPAGWRGTVWEHEYEELVAAGATKPEVAAPARPARVMAIPPAEARIAPYYDQDDPMRVRPHFDED